MESMKPETRDRISTDATAVKLLFVAVIRLTGPFGRRTLSVYSASSSALFTFQPVIVPSAGETTGFGLVEGS